MIRHPIKAIVLACAALLAAVGTSYGLKLKEAAFILADVAAGDGPSAYKNSVPAPQRTAISWTIDGRPNHGDLYVPATGARARLVLVPGLAALGKDDPRLVAFANTLGRAGFLVLVPEIANLREFRAHPDDALVLADAALFLSREYDAGHLPRTAGFAALSYASGPAVLAAMDPRIAETTPFVLSIGGYYSMNDVLTFVTTRKFRLHDDDQWQTGNPASYATWAFLRANAAGADDPRDIDLLTRIADAKLEDENANVEPLSFQLGPEGRAIFDLMTNTDPEAVAGMVARLPPRLRQGLAALDLSQQDLSRLKARMILLHGSDDPMIPSTESRRFAAAIDNVHLAVIAEITHVEFNGASDVIDGIKMVLAMRDMLRFRQ